MGRLVNSTYITLDGVVGEPHEWPSTGSDDGTALKLQTDLLLASDAVLMGRRTYEVFAATWPERSGDSYSDRINTMPKYVASATLTEPAWHHTTVLADQVAERVAELKAGGTNLVQYGFGELSHTLLAHGLIDELRLWVHPLLVGKGDQLFRGGSASAFQLAGTVVLTSGTVVLTYQAR
ncbi:dihydrofolate reductase family protein [Nonomuraea soli]|uniref:Dihydrofolate reductase n=1 Tax=Nonomuraea soli TaxID=1032476 RepID=A0A7W0CIQ3_9ACTN|nr:dihydrofolate reductase family protein [Nonomuraea soli]MBA2891779.1 dihydrofolate reductase [Nonomuraea soli]